MGLGDYGSHFPILAAAVARVTRRTDLERLHLPILELGSGDWSTPMLHYMCAVEKTLVTADTDAKWLEKYRAYESAEHKLHHVERWENWPVLEQHFWGVAFVDCAPGGDRWKLIKRLQGHAHFIVAHDSERDYGTGANYEYEKIRPLFKHVTEWRRFRPYTLILSDIEPFEIAECDKVWDPKNI